jgi:phenylalanyl-tRNA synthetase alpha chain
MHEDEYNALVRIVLRALDRTLTHAECNTLRDEVYAAIHEGRRHSWAVPRSERGHV